MQSSALATHLRHNAPTMPHSPPHSPPFTPPQSYNDAAAALVQRLHLSQRGRGVGVALGRGEGRAVRHDGGIVAQKRL